MRLFDSKTEKLAVLFFIICFLLWIYFVYTKHGIAMSISQIMLVLASLAIGVIVEKN